MIKRILILCTLLLISAYLVLAVTAFNGKPDNRICKGMELVVKDSVNFASMFADWKKHWTSIRLSAMQSVT